MKVWYEGYTFHGHVFSDGKTSPTSSGLFQVLLFAVSQLSDDSVNKIFPGILTTHQGNASMLYIRLPLHHTYKRNLYRA